MVVLAYATVYLVWGSTYFFIQKAVQTFPPFFLGAFRFIVAAALMMTWCLLRDEKVFEVKAIRPAIISGLLLLFVGNGIVIWTEQFLPSGMVAIMVSSSPLWFVLLDRPKWAHNLRNKSTIAGLLIGFGGVGLLFSEQISKAFADISGTKDFYATALLILGSIAWASGSLYSKYRSSGNSATVSTTWQMLSAGLAFMPMSILSGELKSFRLDSIPLEGWMAVVYLIIFGSIIGFSAYVWLLKFQPATKVSTFAYVNPVVAVLLGIFFGLETISSIQIIGLAIILGSVMLINLHEYKNAQRQISL